MYRSEMHLKFTGRMIKPQITSGMQHIRPQIHHTLFDCGRERGKKKKIKPAVGHPRVNVTKD